MRDIQKILNLQIQGFQTLLLLGKSQMDKVELSSNLLSIASSNLNGILFDGLEVEKVSAWGEVAYLSSLEPTLRTSKCNTKYT